MVVRREAYSGQVNHVPPDLIRMGHLLVMELNALASEVLCAQ